MNLTKSFLSEISEKLNSKITSYNEFKSGRASPTFSIKLENNTNYVLKLYTKEKSWRFYNNKKIFEMFSPSKKVSRFIAGGNWKNGKYILMSQLEGSDLEHNNLKFWSTKELNELFQEIGKTTALLHKIKNNKFGEIRNPKFTSWRKYLLQKNKERYKNAKNSKLHILSKNIINCLNNNINTIPEIKKASFVHDDIQPQNLLTSNKKLTGIIDFDLAFWGDSYFELIYCEKIGDYLVPINYKDKIIPSFYKGYELIIKINKKHLRQVRDYYELCKYLRVIDDLKGLKEVLPRKTFENIMKSIIIKSNIILEKRLK